MKAFKVLSIVALAAMSVSCGNAADDFDIAPHISARLCLNVVGTGGDGLIQGLETTDTEYPAMSKLVVAPDQYTLLSSPNRLDVGMYSGGAVKWDYYYIHPFLEFYTPGSLIEDDNYLLGINMPVLREHPEEMITYTLTCPQLFGDDVEHEIVTYWTKETRSLQQDIMKCSRVVIDGREITDISYANDEQVSIATIVLDR